MGVRLRRVVMTGLAALSAVFATTSVAGAARLLPEGQPPAKALYIAIGASESVGAQPTVAVPLGTRTPWGYANVATTNLALLNIPVTTFFTGCPGESSTTALSGDHCGPRPQIDRARAALANYPDLPVYITIDLGFNDLRPCREAKYRIPGCVEAALNGVRANITSLVTQLRAVTPRPLHIIGLTHDNPYVVGTLVGQGADLTRAGVASVAALNRTLLQTYGLLGVPVLDVNALFDNGDTTPVTNPLFGTITAEQNQICAWTWMCATPPFGPNIHVNTNGYAAIATALVALLQSQGLS